MEVCRKEMAECSRASGAWSSPLCPGPSGRIGRHGASVSIGQGSGKKEDDRALGDGRWPMKPPAPLPHTHLQCFEAEIAAWVPRKSGGQCDKNDHAPFKRGLHVGDARGGVYTWGLSGEPSLSSAGCDGAAVAAGRQRAIATMCSSPLAHPALNHVVSVPFTTRHTCTPPPLPGCRTSFVSRSSSDGWPGAVWHAELVRVIGAQL